MTAVTRYIHSAYVKKSLHPELTAALEHDMQIFGDMKLDAFVQYNTGRDKKDAAGNSLHVRLKNEYGVNDYFANSARQEAKAVISSQKELAQLYISDTKECISRLEKKLRKLSQQLAKMQTLKSQIISATKLGLRVNYPRLKSQA